MRIEKNNTSNYNEFQFYRKIRVRIEKNKGLMSRFFLQKNNNGNDETFERKESPPPASPLTQPLFPFPLPCYILQMKPQGNYYKSKSRRHRQCRTKNIFSTLKNIFIFVTFNFV